MPRRGRAPILQSQSGVRGPTSSKQSADGGRGVGRRIWTYPVFPLEITTKGVPGPRPLRSQIHGHPGGSRLHLPKTLLQQGLLCKSVFPARTPMIRRAGGGPHSQFQAPIARSPDEIYCPPRERAGDKAPCFTTSPHVPHSAPLPPDLQTKSAVPPDPHLHT